MLALFMGGLLLSGVKREGFSGCMTPQRPWKSRKSSGAAARIHRCGTEMPTRISIGKTLAAGIVSCALDLVEIAKIPLVLLPRSGGVLQEFKGRATWYPPEHRAGIPGAGHR